MEFIDVKRKQLHETSQYARSLIEASLDLLISPEGKYYSNYSHL